MNDIRQLRVLVNNRILRPSFVPHQPRMENQQKIEKAQKKELQKEEIQANPKRIERKTEGQKKQRRTRERRNTKKWKEFEERFGWVFEKLEVRERGFES